MKENKQACLLSALQQTLDSAATFWMLIYKHSITALTSNNRAKIKYTMIYSIVYVNRNTICWVACTMVCIPVNGQNEDLFQWSYIVLSMHLQNKQSICFSFYHHLLLKLRTNITYRPIATEWWSLQKYGRIKIHT